MKRIMLIDHDLEQLRATALSLSSDFRTLNCTRGSKAMDLFKLFLPHGLILDPATPGLEEGRFIEKVRELPGGYRIPILGATRFTGPRSIERAFQWKVDALYSKPCAPEKLREKLLGLLGQPLRAPTSERTPELNLDLTAP